MSSQSLLLSLPWRVTGSENFNAFTSVTIKSVAYNKEKKIILKKMKKVVASQIYH